MINHNREVCNHAIEKLVSILSIDWIDGIQSQFTGQLSLDRNFPTDVSLLIKLQFHVSWGC